MMRMVRDGAEVKSLVMVEGDGRTGRNKVSEREARGLEMGVACEWTVAMGLATDTGRRKRDGREWEARGSSRLLSGAREAEKGGSLVTVNGIAR
ncbi:hypothetical protein AMTR_s00113p00033740 [Amborella trichopoda]|uniref:Uncharacterized protein n=1 Tax=Amborella trichopoda TaxID=13333 RepID=W1NS93_AMBTC|nr:hypothetical protein AMTR_s00113p00033740 [Amborella trichopoda]